MIKYNLKELVNRLVHDSKHIGENNAIDLKILRHRQRIVQCCVDNINDNKLEDIYLCDTVGMKVLYHILQLLQLNHFYIFMIVWKNQTANSYQKY